MNNFSKIYTAEELMGNKTITLISLPMEESIMVPVAWAIDLMKQGQNVLYFTFHHDSIKINEFFKMALSNYTEEEAKSITGNIAIIDASQIPLGMSWEEFFKNSIMEVKSECELNFVFFDVMEFIKSDCKSLIKKLNDISFASVFTKFIIDTSGVPVFTTIQGKKTNSINETFQDKKLRSIINSDIALTIRREKESFLKKVINFLLFWRKSNNFTLNIIKNRIGKTKSYRMNIDMDNSKTEIL